MPDWITQHNLRRADLRLSQARRLFESGGATGARANPVVDLEWFVDKIEERKLSLSFSHIDEECCERAVREVGGINRAGESTAHRFMKRVMYHWMLEDGLEGVVEEYLSYGLRFDVADRYAEWMVECGNTQVRKLETLIRSPHRPRFFIIPFQAAAFDCLEGRIRPLVVIEVDWHPSLRNELEREAA